MCKQTKGGSQPLFTMFPFRLHGVKMGRHQVRRCAGVSQRSASAFGHGVHSVAVVLMRNKVVLTWSFPMTDLALKKYVYMSGDSSKATWQSSTGPAAA